MTQQAYDRTECTIGFGQNDNHVVSVSCTEELGSRFKAAKHRSEERSGLTLTHAEFLQLLLNVWEEHEEPGCSE